MQQSWWQGRDFLVEELAEDEVGEGRRKGGDGPVEVLAKGEMGEGGRKEIVYWLVEVGTKS